MRNYLIVLALLLAGSTATAATRRVGGLSEFQPVEAPKKLSQEEARKKAAGIKDVQGFGADKIQEEPPFPWKALGGSLLLLLALVPVGLKLFRSTQKDLTDLSTFGMQKGSGEGKSGKSGGRPPSRRKGAAKSAADETMVLQEADDAAAAATDAAGARDAVWDAINSAGDWVGADWIASTASLPISQANEELGALVEEGYLEEARDRAGKPIFRLAAA